MTVAGYEHGVKVFEWPTNLVAPRAVESALPFYVGTAPIHLSESGLRDTSKQVNNPILANEYQEAVSKLGYSDDWDKSTGYTLCEAIYAHFSLFSKSPVIFVNVLDPARHKTTVESSEYAIANKQAKLAREVILDSVVVKATSAGDALVAGTDYSLSWDSADNAVINILDGGALIGATSLYAAYDKIDPSKVTKADIIGGYNNVTKNYEGLALVDQVFMKLGKIPALILAPGWSDEPEVAAVLASKATSITGLFPSLSVVDIPATVTDYTEVSEWKRLNSYTDSRQVACWPLGKLGDRVFHLSTLFACLCAVTDTEYNDIPYASPSNHLSRMTAAVDANGREMILTLDQANDLNAAGIVTLLNWESGWQLWGDETACYPANTDPKDRFINVRRFFNWWAVKFILRWFQKVDKPINRRLLETIEDSENIQINGYVAIGALVGPNNRLEFPADENPVTDLLDGIIKAHTYLTVPPPARLLENGLEYETDNLTTLFL